MNGIQPVCKQIISWWLHLFMAFYWQDSGVFTPSFESFKEVAGKSSSRYDLAEFQRTVSFIRGKEIYTMDHGSSLTTKNLEKGFMTHRSGFNVENQD